MYKFLFIIEKLFYLFKYFYQKINIFIKKFSFKKIFQKIKKKKNYQNNYIYFIEFLSEVLTINEFFLI